MALWEDDRDTMWKDDRRTKDVVAPKRDPDFVLVLNPLVSTSKGPVRNTWSSEFWFEEMVVAHMDRAVIERSVETPAGTLAHDPTSFRTEDQQWTGEYGTPVQEAFQRWKANKQAEKILIEGR